MFITNISLLQRLSCGLCFKQQTDTQIQIYFHTTFFFFVKNSFEKHKQTQTDVCFFLFYLCCSPSSASRAKNTLFFLKRVLILKADNFQMIHVVDMTCWLRTGVWCTAGEYTGLCLTHRGVQEDTKAAWFSWQEGHAQCLPILRISHSGEVGAAPSTSCCTEPLCGEESSFLHLAMWFRRLMITFY